MSTITRPISRLIFRSICRPAHLDRYNGLVSTDKSVEHRSMCRSIYRSKGAQNTHDTGEGTMESEILGRSRFCSLLEFQLRDIL